MNKIEALRKEADLREMCEGTTVQWWECVRGYCKNICPSEDIAHEWLGEFRYEAHFALAIVENKPIFADDYIYSIRTGRKIRVAQIKNNLLDVQCVWEDEEEWTEELKNCSLSPPKNRTVLVELLVEDAEYLEKRFSNSIEEACRKALEQLNGGGK